MNDCQSLEENQLRRKIGKLWNSLRIIDRVRLSRQRHAFQDLLNKAPAQAVAEAGPYLDKLEQAAKRSLIPIASKIKCEFPKALPITERINDIREAIRKHSVIVVCGTTGSGKTTQLPKAALLEGYGRRGRIGCTQPRRIAATSLARRLSVETGCQGREIGYQVRFDDHTDDTTVIKFMTDGILLAETQNDPKLFQYDCIILDEVHERSLNIDFLLGYLKLLLQKRPDLKVIISSATLDTQRISAFFGDAPIIDVGGRVFPVEDFYLEPEQDDELADSVARGVEFLPPEGDILVFLPGEREIRDCADMLNGRNYPHTDVLPLFGRMSTGDQERIFSPKSSSRRIILATNVAETSITIPGIRYVVDSNLVRLSRYNPKSGIQELRIENISKASAMQRRGRCGRERDGICVHLCSQQQFEDASEFTPPEIQRASLAGVILQMAALKLPPIINFPLVDPPSMQLIHEGMTTLSDLHAIDQAGALTDIGRRLAELPVGPRLGRILIDSERRGVFPELLIITSFLAIQDPRERPFDKAKEADAAQKKFEVDNSDFMGIIKLWLAIDDIIRVSKSQLRRFCKTNYLNFRRVTEWRNLAADLLDSMNPDGADLDSLKIDFIADRCDPVHKSLLCGLPRRLAFYDAEKKYYYDRTGRCFTIFPGSALARMKKPPQWLLCFSIVETSRVFARICAEVEGWWLEEIAPQLCSCIYDRVEWNPDSGFVTARERVMAGRLPIHPGRRCHYGRVNAEEARTVFIKEAFVPALVPSQAAPWIAQYNQLICHLRSLEAKIRQEHAIVDDDAIEAFFTTRLPKHIYSTAAVKEHWKSHKQSFAPMVNDVTLENAPAVREADFPDEIESDGEHYPIKYIFNPGENDDGIQLVLPETHLNLISRSIPDFLVPGYLRWKVDFLLRSLPKTSRKMLLPLEECTEGFLNGLRTGDVYPGGNFFHTLGVFLRKFRNCELDEGLFEDAELPKYLRMKFAIVDSHGNLLRLIRELPATENSAATVSNRHKTARKWDLSGFSTWPEEMPNLPDKLLLNGESGRDVFPAFFCEPAKKTIGCSLFLEQQEAMQEHRNAVLHLFHLIYPKMFEYMLGRIKPGRDLENEFFSDYPNWRNDLVHSAVAHAIGCDPASIRTVHAFDTARIALCDRLAGAVENSTATLISILKSYAPIENLLDTIPEDTYTYEDVNCQLAVLFRKGFLRTPEALVRYPRYMKSLKTRLERADHAYARDAAKGASIEPWIRRFHLLFDTGTDLETNQEFFQFFLLLEEARIAAWTPEITTLAKATAKTLEQAFQPIRISGLSSKVRK